MRVPCGKRLRSPSPRRGLARSRSLGPRGPLRWQIPKTTSQVVLVSPEERENGRQLWVDTTISVVRGAAVYGPSSMRYSRIEPLSKGELTIVPPPRRGGNNFGERIRWRRSACHRLISVVPPGLGDHRMALDAGVSADFIGKSYGPWNLELSSLTLLIVLRAAPC